MKNRIFLLLSAIMLTVTTSTVLGSEKRRLDLEKRQLDSERFFNKEYNKKKDGPIEFDGVEKVEKVDGSTYWLIHAYDKNSGFILKQYPKNPNKNIGQWWYDRKARYRTEDKQKTTSYNIIYFGLPILVKKQLKQMLEIETKKKKLTPIKKQLVWWFKK